MLSMIKRIAVYFLLSALFLLSACASPTGESENEGRIIASLL